MRASGRQVCLFSRSLLRNSKLHLEPLFVLELWCHRRSFGPASEGQVAAAEAFVQCQFHALFVVSFVLSMAIRVPHLSGEFRGHGPMGSLARPRTRTLAAVIFMHLDGSQINARAFPDTTQGPTP